MPEVDVAVVGAGAAGALVCLHVARSAPGLRLALVGPGPAGLGVAYATGAPEHLLHVPAARMSAYPEEPDGFVAWLRRRGVAADGQAFVPPRLFGAYVQELLAAHPGPLLRVPSPATALAPAPDGLRLSTGDGGSLEARVVVLATGVLVPELPAPLRGLAVRAWDAGAFAGLAPDDPVLLLGTGLTMVDAALRLAGQGHRGALHALSRHGLLPAPHAPGPLRQSTAALPVRQLPPRVGALVGAVRRAAAQEEAAGSDWRTVMDALRPLAPEIWASLPLPERRRFLRHVWPYWDAHRHRMAPESARALYGLRRRGQLRVHAGRLLAAARDGERLRVTWRDRATGTAERLAVARVVDCATAAGATEAASPLLRSAAAAGLVRWDPLGLGIETGSVGAAVGREGVSSRLFAVGALRRFERWESTAIPELRAQAAVLAAYLAERLRAPAPGVPPRR